MVWLIKYIEGACLSGESNPRRGGRIWSPRAMGDGRLVGESRIIHTEGLQDFWVIYTCSGVTGLLAPPH